MGCQYCEMEAESLELMVQQQMHKLKLAQQVYEEQAQARMQKQMSQDLETPQLQTLEQSSASADDMYFERAQVD